MFRHDRVTDSAQLTIQPHLAPTLVERIAAEYGTPTYVYELAALRQWVRQVRSAIPAQMDMYYCLKANPSLGLSQLMAALGLGAEVSSVGELLTAQAAGFRGERLLVTGPYKSPELRAELAKSPGAMVSVDSISELEMLSQQPGPQRDVLLRLRPDFSSEAVVCTATESRFGIPFQDLRLCLPLLTSGQVRVVGFHIFAGSQVSDTAEVVTQLRAALDLAARAAVTLDIRPSVIDLGGGFGVPVGPQEAELDLTQIGTELVRLATLAEPARLAIELGRYLVARSGWYLTRVVGHQTRGGCPAVIVDGGVHQRPDICGLGLASAGWSPVLLPERDSRLRDVDVLGCLCLPDDILAEQVTLPEPAVGDILAFADAGAYGLSAAPTNFLSHPAPPEVAVDGDKVTVLRQRPNSGHVLDGQRPLEE